MPKARMSYPNLLSSFTVSALWFSKWRPSLTADSPLIAYLLNLRSAVDV